MKTLEIGEKLRIYEGGVLTKVLISQLLITQEYQTAWMFSLSNSGINEYYWKHSELEQNSRKLRVYTYKLTHISAAGFSLE